MQLRLLRARALSHGHPICTEVDALNPEFTFPIAITCAGVATRRADSLQHHETHNTDHTRNQRLDAGLITPAHDAPPDSLRRFIWTQRQRQHIMLQMVQQHHFVKRQRHHCTHWDLQPSLPLPVYVFILLRLSNERFSV